MIIGNGLVAKAFSAYSQNTNIIIFASGVSNSTSTSKQDFQREEALLVKTLELHSDKKVVYVSTCSIYDQSLKNSAYVHHKLEMEKLVSTNAAYYYIFRISNLAGKTPNPHTILNFFFQHVILQRPFHLWRKAYRNIIDVEDAVSICTYFIEQDAHLNQIINIANPVNYPVSEIVSVIEKKARKKAIYTIIDKGASPIIDTTLAQKAINKLHLNFAGNYLERVIEKYLFQDDL